jgi:hypothetical protein
MISGNPQKMLLEPPAGWCIEVVMVLFTRFVRRHDDANTSQIDRRRVGAVSLLRGRLPLELSPCARSAEDGHP